MRKVELNGHEAYRCEISGTLEKLKLEYQFTVVESTNDYHQILAWTSHSRKDTPFRVFGDVLRTCELH